MALSYKTARAEIMRAIQVVEEILEHSAAPEPLKTRLKLFSALHRELAAIDSKHLGESDAEYAAITLRFSSATKDLRDAHAEAKKLGDKLGAAAQLIQSLTKLAGAL
jgi:hypothetical protein